MRASPQKLLCVLCVINMFLILKNIIYNIYIIFYNTHTHNIFSLSLPIADIHIIRTKTLLFILFFCYFIFYFIKHWKIIEKNKLIITSILFINSLAHKYTQRKHTHIHLNYICDVYIYNISIYNFFDFLHQK